ncbi:MAG TPA: hypothetical protein VLN46_00760 [Gillisia sp.]|nr:hypothetical protein [Gillisia sp.]
MNTLIKYIITTLIGFVSTLADIDESGVKIQSVESRDIQISPNDLKGEGYCTFNVNSCKMLKNEFES